MESERKMKTITKLDENVYHMSILMSQEVCWIIPNMMLSQFDVMSGMAEAHKVHIK